MLHPWLLVYYYYCYSAVI